tara:strand:- start:29 stop:640 length:612 start_codon:yes stop_codon:yes gene_type:complete
MPDLFSDNTKSCQRLDLDHASVIYYPDFFSKSKSGLYFKELYEETPWQQDDIKIFGKIYPQPRLTALYAGNGLPYSYSGITMHPHHFTPTLQHIKELVEGICNTEFTTCLLNLYRNGQDSNGWHADDEKELGKNPVIASVSFGAERFFKMRPKDRKGETIKLKLAHGSLLIMAGETQHFWQHELPKTKLVIEPRINLTFRVIK